jgi:hypothetical protein
MAENAKQVQTIQPVSRSKAVYITGGILLFLLVFSFARIPYTGAYIDSYTFDFLFGTYKYFIYLYVASLLVI